MRTHTNGELRISDIEKEVVLCGWVAKSRNLGSLIFVDLRDRYGITQIAAKAGSEAYDVLATVGNEYVLKVKGKVIERESKNPNLPTGDIEVEASYVEILSKAAQPPMIVADKTDALEDFRMKYRYLDLRRPCMQSNLILRHDITKAVRRYFDDLNFVDVETPAFGKSTPEGARDYLVPSRIHPGKFYALPQSPQLYKQLLMVAGMDRYYQIAKCFRDEDLRADRQMEFTQIDVEMSFIDEEDIYTLMEGMFKKVFKDVMNIDLATPFRRIRFDDSMALYGNDKPDLRFGLELKDITSLAKEMNFVVFDNAINDGGIVKCVISPNASKYSRKDIDKLTEDIKKYKAKGLAWFKFDGEAVNGSIAKFVTPEILAKFKELGLEKDNLVLIVADKKNVVNASLSYLRNFLGKDLGLIDENRYEFTWITDWPSFEWDEEENRWVAAHHPFTMPKDECVDKLLTKPEECYSKCYDIVLNGYELGSGSIRIHNQDVQETMFKAIGLTEEEIKAKFGFFVEGLKYGTPPHGGIAVGLDRLAMLLTHSSSLREVIAFPKSANAICPMSEAPSVVDERQLKELKIHFDK